MRARWAAAAAGVAILAGAAWAATDRGGYRLATEPRAFRFPRDHASHPEYRVEWWYYTGHLDGAGRRFGYQVTFFRVGLDRARAASRSAWAPHTVLFAHLALTDERGRRFRFDERIQRPALGMAGADTASYRVWVDDWSAELLADGRRHRLRANAADFGVTLELEPLDPPVVHGRDGLSRKSAEPGNASHYYSLARMATRGVIRVAGESLAVGGSSWMDHEFGSSQLDSAQVGWDWLSLQLEGGEELMVYRLRRRDGSDEPFSSGTWVARDGRATHLPRAAFTLDASGRWKSPRSGAAYPRTWRVRVPSLGLDLETVPTVDDQELVTRSTGGVVYWEGSVRVAGTLAGRATSGRGYVEMTGYAGAPPGL